MSFKFKMRIMQTTQNLMLITRNWIIGLKDAGVAQLVRASAFQAEGRGFESRFPLQNSERVELLPALKARVAQSEEHFLGKEVVTGSIPVVGSINLKTEVLYG
jgi:hypothetical protein